ncbi:MAG: PAS domain-containing protein [Bryobacteraceae bacterium]
MKSSEPVKPSTHLNEALLRAIVENHSDAILIVDLGGIVIYLNPAAEAMFERRKNRLLGEYFGYPLVDGRTAEIDIVHTDRTIGVAEMRVGTILWGSQQAWLVSLRG